MSGIDRVPVADPAAEYRELAAEIDAALQRVLASGRYILGPEGAALERAGVASMISYPVPLHRQPLYAAANAERSLPAAEEAARTVLSLPIFPQLPAQAVQRVCQALRASL